MVNSRNVSSSTQSLRFADQGGGEDTICLQRERDVEEAGEASTKTKVARN